jgi:hypothetical protein
LGAGGFLPKVGMLHFPKSWHVGKNIFEPRSRGRPPAELPTFHEDIFMPMFGNMPTLAI